MGTESENTCTRDDCTKPKLDGFDLCATHIPEEYTFEEFVKETGADVNVVRMADIARTALGKALGMAPDPALMVLSALHANMDRGPNPEVHGSDEAHEDHERMGALTERVEQQHPTTAITDLRDADVIRILAANLMVLAVESGFSGCIHRDENPVAWHLMDVAERIDMAELGIPEETVPEPKYDQAQTKPLCANECGRTRKRGGEVCCDVCEHSPNSGHTAWCDTRERNRRG